MAKKGDMPDHKQGKNHEHAQKDAVGQNGSDSDLIELGDEMDDEIYMELDDERREELEEMVGLKVVGIEVWDDSLGDDEKNPPNSDERVFFDCDIFLEGDQALELYVAAAYPDPDGDPLTGMNAIYQAIGALSDDELELLDYDAVDEEGGLALAFGHDDHVHLVLAASGWMVSEWEADEGEGESDEA